MELGLKTCRLNHLDEERMKIQPNDFFMEIGGLKKAGLLLDCVILDPPFFSTTARGTVDMVNQGARMINKCRPLIKDGGWLISINNALFVSGKDLQTSNDLLCSDGYLQVEEIINVPEDITGFPQILKGGFPVDPTPYNHPTKITIFKIRRK